MSGAAKRMRLKKTDKTETMPNRITLAPNERQDALVTYLKASIEAPRFRQRTGAEPFAPVLVREGSRKFRGTAVPEYPREEIDKKDLKNYIYMGISINSSASDVCLVNSLGLVSIPTIVHGLADLYVTDQVFGKLKISQPIYWPDGDKGIRIGVFIQVIIPPSTEDSASSTRHKTARIRVLVDSVGSSILKQ